jgi:hypothetical protein
MHGQVLNDRCMFLYITLHRHKPQQPNKSSRSVNAKRLLKQQMRHCLVETIKSRAHSCQNTSATRLLYQLVHQAQRPYMPLRFTVALTTNGRGVICIFVQTGNAAAQQAMPYHEEAHGELACHCVHTKNDHSSCT